MNAKQLPSTAEGQRYCTENSADCFEINPAAKAAIEAAQAASRQPNWSYRTVSVEAASAHVKSAGATMVGDERRDAKAKRAPDESSIGKITRAPDAPIAWKR